MSLRLPTLFVTGTDTGAGKTFFTSLLLQSLRGQGIDAVGMKPICCGDRDDAEALVAACEGVATLNEVNPVWLRTPAAPYVASMIEERIIDVSLIMEAFHTLHSRHECVIVEGAGGWLVPIASDSTMADLAVSMAARVVLVAENRLGCLNHALLTWRAIQASGLACAGIVLNAPRALPPEHGIATATNGPILEELTGTPILATISCGVPVLPEISHAQLFGDQPEHLSRNTM